MVWEAAKAVRIPVIGMGGITTPEDAVEFLLAGATAVQVGTASYADPRAVERLAKGLETWCRGESRGAGERFDRRATVGSAETLAGIRSKKKASRQGWPFIDSVGQDQATRESLSSNDRP